MLRLLSADLWPLIAKLARTSVRKQAAIAYASSDRHLKFGQGDVLVTDATDGAIAAGQTSATVLSKAASRGARLYSLGDLHAKVICIGRYVVAGSANASAASADRLVEAAVVSDNPSLLAEARSLVEQLTAVAIPIDGVFLARIGKIEVRRAVAPARPRRVRVEDRESRTWIVGVHPLDEDRYADEAELAEEGQREAEAKLDSDENEVSWLRFTGTSRFRRDAAQGDTVIQVWRKRTKSKTAYVYYPSPILLRQEEPSCTRFYVEDFVDQDERSISWTEFKRIWGLATAAAAPPLACARLLPQQTAEPIIALWPDHRRR